MSEDRQAHRRIRVVVADDDAFASSLIADSLRMAGYDCRAASSAEEAWHFIKDGETNALITDLDFGSGTSGATLLERVAERLPWVGMIVLTSHVSPSLAVDDATALPSNIFYLVKSQITSVAQITAAIEQAIAGGPAVTWPVSGTTRHVVTPAQAEVLRMLAAGDSTRMIAERRSTSVRAAETMIGRVFTALGLEDDDKSNLRVEAVRIWQQGTVSVR